MSELLIQSKFELIPVITREEPACAGGEVNWNHADIGTEAYKATYIPEAILGISGNPMVVNELPYREDVGAGLIQLETMEEGGIVASYIFVLKEELAVNSTSRYFDLNRILLTSEQDFSNIKIPKIQISKSEFEDNLSLLHPELALVDLEQYYKGEKPIVTYDIDSKLTGLTNEIWYQKYLLANYCRNTENSLDDKDIYIRQLFRESSKQAENNIHLFREFLTAAKNTYNYDLHNDLVAFYIENEDNYPEYLRLPTREMFWKESTSSGVEKYKIVKVLETFISRLLS